MRCDSMKEVSGIYLIENKINGKKYIGQSINNILKNKISLNLIIIQLGIMEYILRKTVIINKVLLINIVGQRMEKEEKFLELI